MLPFRQRSAPVLNAGLHLARVCQDFGDDPTVWPRQLSATLTSVLGGPVVVTLVPSHPGKCYVLGGAAPDGGSDPTPADLGGIQTVIEGYVGGPLAGPAEPAPSALPRMPRQVLKLLLQGCSDKETAARLAISRRTAAQYARTVYQHFAVDGRGELLARWIARGWTSRCAWADPPVTAPCTSAAGCPRPRVPPQPAGK